MLYNIRVYYRKKTQKKIVKDVCWGVTHMHTHTNKPPPLRLTHTYFRTVNSPKMCSIYTTSKRGNGIKWQFTLCAQHRASHAPCALTHIRPPPLVTIMHKHKHMCKCLRARVFAFIQVESGNYASLANTRERTPLDLAQTHRRGLRTLPAAAPRSAAMYNWNIFMCECESALHMGKSY